ncbi:MAG: histidine phosphatase family protein [Candidatus Saccharibacteria bacterium]
MQHLYFVRHGLSVMNKQGIFSGRTETPLAREGVQQAELAGSHAAGLHIDCIVSSPMKRAIDTATIIAQKIGYPVEKIIVSDLFMERAFGPLEGTAYQPNMKIEHIEGVEKAELIVQRARAGVEYLHSLPAETILVVSHGAIGRALRHCLNPTTPFHDSARFANAEVTKLL